MNRNDIVSQIDSLIITSNEGLNYTNKEDLDKDLSCAINILSKVIEDELKTAEIHNYDADEMSNIKAMCEILDKAIRVLKRYIY